MFRAEFSDAPSGCLVWMALPGLSSHAASSHARRAACSRSDVGDGAAVSVRSL